MRKNVWHSAPFSVALRAYASYWLPMWSYCALCSVIGASLLSCLSSVEHSRTPNALRQPRLEATARHERRLEGVGWTRLLGLHRSLGPWKTVPPAFPNQ